MLDGGGAKKDDLDVKRQAGDQVWIRNVDADEAD